MDNKIDVASGDPYRGQGGKFGTSPIQKLQAAIADLQSKTLVDPEENDKLVDSKTEEAKDKLAELRGNKDSGEGKADKIGKHSIVGYDANERAIDANGDVQTYKGSTYWFSKKTGMLYSDSNSDGTPDPIEPDDDYTPEDAIENYTMESNLWINADLRAAQGDETKYKDDSTKEEVSKIDQLFKDTPPSKPLYRGTTAVLDLKEGGTFTDYAYGSASTDRNVGIGFASPDNSQGKAYYTREHQEGEKSFVFQITPKKNTKVIDTQKHGYGEDGENEIIMPRGTKYKVNKITPNQKVTGDEYDAGYNYDLVELQVL